MQAWHFPGSCRLPLKLHYPGHQGLSCLLRAVQHCVEGIPQLGRLGVKGWGQTHHSPAVPLCVRGIRTLKLCFKKRIGGKSSVTFGLDQETGRTETRVGCSDTVNNVEISKPCFFQVSRYERRVNYPCRLNSRGEREKKKRLCIFMKALQWC